MRSRKTTIAVIEDEDEIVDRQRQGLSIELPVIMHKDDVFIPVETAPTAKAHTAPKPKVESPSTSTKSKPRLRRKPPEPRKPQWENSETTFPVVLEQDGDPSKTDLEKIHKIVQEFSWV